MGEKVYGLTVLDTWWMTETGGHMIVNYPTMDVSLAQWANHYLVFKLQLSMMQVMNYHQIEWAILL